MYVRPRLLIATAVLSATLAACTGHAAPATPKAPSPAGGATASVTPSATPSPAPSATAAPQTPSASPAAPTPDPVRTATPVVKTHLSMSVATTGGRLNLVRGGPAQEFTVTLRNGNSKEYRHLLLAFQMESLVPGPGDIPSTGTDFLLERRDPATGTWRPADLRIANDFKPYGLYEGGAALARDAVRVERYRLRATAAGATGSTPVMVSVIDTDAPEGATPAQERPGYYSLPHTTKRRP
ncbi:hypothetical protein [Streptomyces sp. ISL-86]|uniref:hypothetical protein n=1 Tax=Streptomyces sp. ISL-86 TaxID=2819187 RepID=UPI001BED3072|nr:hypothetical protein [Streptomyces sp. ISL-86]MBT2458694.1 hypothetical protein [Streptomyces sp. ISL-86]